MIVLYFNDVVLSLTWDSYYFSV